MVLTIAVVVVDFILPFFLVLGGVWLARSKSLFVEGTRQNLTRWGIAVVIACVLVWIFMGGYLLDSDVNRVAGWLGVRVPEPLITIPNILKVLVLITMWFGFIYYNAVRSLIQRPFKLANLFLPGYAIYITAVFVRGIIEAVRKTG